MSYTISSTSAYVIDSHSSEERSTQTQGEGKTVQIDPIPKVTISGANARLIGSR